MEIFRGVHISGVCCLFPALLRYAFVQFCSYFDAACAVAGVNKTKVKGCVVTVDWLLPKAEYQSLH